MRGTETGSMWKDLRVPGPRKILTHGLAVLGASVAAAAAVAAMDSLFAALMALLV